MKELFSENNDENISMPLLNTLHLLDLILKLVHQKKYSVAFYSLLLLSGIQVKLQIIFK